MAKVCIDTNILLKYPEVLDEFDDIILPSAVLEEVDGLKKAEGLLGYQAREAHRKLESNIDKINFVLKDIYEDMQDGWDVNKRDNKIVMTALENKATLLSNDINVRCKAKAIGIECKGYGDDCKVEDDREYKGYTEIELTDIDLAEFYLNKDKAINQFNLEINEYIIIRSNGIIVDKYKWTNNGYINVVKKNIDSSMFGKLKPKDDYQQIAIDSLINDQFTAIAGKQGSGKSLLSLMYAMWALEKGKFDSIVILYNPTPLRGSESQGFYKGDALDKGLQSFIGHMLTSKFGDRMIVDSLISQGKIRLIAMCDCRGMEITDNQILYITEAQNTTIDLMKTCLARVSQGAKVIIEGDPSGQVDNNIYQGGKNGMNRMIEVFKGEDLFSFIELKNVHRSKIADIINKM